MNDSGVLFKSRVKRSVHLFQILPVHVRINLGRNDIGMAEHLLNRAEVRAAFKQMGRERVAKGVR
jgi:hypothetical protein